MDWNKHSNLEGCHAFLSASKYHWINYDEEKLESTYKNYLSVFKGTQFHELAHSLISLNVKLPSSRKTLNMFVNDAIGYRMNSEQVLYYSPNCFGTSDAISFRNGLLRIHDLKTGDSKASPKQLMVYAALFCLEYRYDPFDIQIELRLYQSDDIKTYIPEAAEIRQIMDKIVLFDKKINELNSEEE